MGYRFLLTEEHLQVLSIYRWDVDNDMYAWEIEGKCSKDEDETLADAAEALGWDIFEDRHGKKHLSEVQADMIQTLLRTLPDALLIVCKMVGNLSANLPGVYEIVGCDVTRVGDL